MDFASFAQPPPPKKESFADHLRTFFHDENGVMIINTELNEEQRAEHNERVRIMAEVEELRPADNDDARFLCDADGCPGAYKRIDDLVDHISKEIALERRSELGMEKVHVMLGRELGCEDQDSKENRKTALTRSLQRKYEEKSTLVVLDKRPHFESLAEERPAHLTAAAGKAPVATVGPAPEGWLERNRRLCKKLGTVAGPQPAFHELYANSQSVTFGNAAGDAADYRHARAKMEAHGMDLSNITWGGKDDKLTRF